MASNAQQLRLRLQEIVALADRLLDVSEIEYDPHKLERMVRATGIAALLPGSTWRPLEDEGRRRQREVLERWDRWLEHMKLLLSRDGEDTRHQLDEAAEVVSRWLHRSGRDFSVPRRIEDARSVFGKHVAPLFELLAPFQGEGPTVVVPDTNVLLRNQDLPSWADALGTSRFTVLLVPGVLHEIDEAKLNHRNQAVREKALKFSSRVKGWRKQGSLTAGVRVQSDVFVRVVAREPDFARTLSWLDPTIVDDRIIAAVLDFQRNNPATDVRLLSGDSIIFAHPHLSRSYARAARKLQDAAASRAEAIDVLAPTVFCVRHAVELALKDLLSAHHGNECDQAAIDRHERRVTAAAPLPDADLEMIARSHDLKELLGLVETYLACYVTPTWRELVDAIARLEQGHGSADPDEGQTVPAFAERFRYETVGPRLRGTVRRVTHSFPVGLVAPTTCSTR